MPSSMFSRIAPTNAQAVFTVTFFRFDSSCTEDCNASDAAAVVVRKPRPPRCNTGPAHGCGEGARVGL